MKKHSIAGANSWLSIICFTSFFILLTNLTNAQTRITGKIIDSATAKPLPDASVYIANSTIGTKTDKNGDYSFSQLTPGSYELITSCLGYQSKQIAFTARSGENIVNITLNARSIELKEVTINARDDWKHNLSLFKREFIGTSNTQECSILNPEILNLDFDYKKNRLSATTDEFLEIKNSRLGYKLRFLVKDFWADYNSGKCHYSGSVIFEELPGKKSDQRKWLKNRQDTYNGSFTHFLVALSSITLSKEKYVVYKMSRTVNPDWLADSIKRHQNKEVLTHGQQRVITFSVTPPKTIETLDKKPIAEADIAKLAAQPDMYSLQFPGYLYVIYKNKRVDTDMDDLHRQPIAADYQISAMRLKYPSRPVYFNSNGVLLTREKLLFEGAWDSRIVDLLPFDYKPSQK